MKKVKILVLMLVIANLLSGCMFKSGDELLQAPKPSTDYIALQNKLDLEISKGSVYAAADSGSNRATIQLIDIDADAQEEAVAFFRESALSGTFNVVVYKKVGEQYVDMGRITGHGSSIDTVEYPKLSPIGAGGIAVSWKISNQLERGLTVAKFENGTLEVVLDTQYMSYFIYDIDYDGLDEIFVVNEENGRNFVSMYDMVDGNMELASTTELSIEIDTIARITTGELASGGRAVSLDSRISGESGLISDVIALNYENELVNLTTDPESVSGLATFRLLSSYTSKLNTTNYLYIPTVSPMYGYPADNSNSSNWITTWHMYDVYNSTKSDIYTYHNNAEGWYYALSENQISNVVVARSTTSNIKITQFQYYINEKDYVSLFEIYTVPVEDYQDSQFADGYIKLGKTTTNVYLARNLNPQSTVKVLDEQIIENFNIIGGSN